MDLSNNPRAVDLGGAHQAAAAPAIEYCYSTDEEEYSGRFSTVDEALDGASEDLAGQRDAGEAAVVWVGEVVPAERTLRRLNLDTEVEYLVERVDEMLGEEIPSDDTIIELAREKHAGLAQLIKGYLCEHGRFNRWSVDNPVQHTIVVGAE
jgi:hypothetical protein